MSKKVKVFCDKCGGKGFYYDYGHSGETAYYHECDKCHSSGYLFVTEEEAKYEDIYFHPPSATFILPTHAF